MSTSKREEFQTDCLNGESSCSNSSSETALLTNNAPPRAADRASIEGNVPKDLISRLLFVSDEEALQYGDEILRFLWKETFPTSNSYPTDHSLLLEQLRIFHPKGNLKKDDNLFKVVNKKRKLEECLENVHNLYTDNINTGNSLLEEEKTFHLFPGNLAEFETLVKVKKLKTEFVQAIGEVCEELEVQTQKSLKLEDQLEKQNKEMKEIIRDLKKESNMRLALDIFDKMRSSSYIRKRSKGQIIEILNDFLYNLDLLETGRNDLTPSDFQDFEKFRTNFPYDCDLPQSNTREISAEEYVQWLCSLFKRVN